MTDIWAAVQDAVTLGPIAGQLVRVVESQEQIATSHLVDDLDEQGILESLLDGSKPPPPPASRGLHYLLQTPFRYPPLPYGSRFGRRFEPSLLYGSQTVDTALAETAYYRFVFWYGMATPPPSGRLLTQHAAFGVAYATGRGVALQHPPFADFDAQLTDPGSYAATQQLGSSLREAGVQAFEYVSARDPQRGINVGVFTPSALAAAKPHYLEPWVCETHGETVRFRAADQGRQQAYPLATFLLDGDLPMPAA